MLEASPVTSRGDMAGTCRKASITLGVAVALAAAITGCGGVGPPTAPAQTTIAASPDPAATIRAPAGTGHLRVLVEPQAGMGVVYRLITGARSSVNLTVYELADPMAEADLAAAAARGVNVRVILDQHLERRANTPAYRYLAAHGVHVRWGPAGVIFHQKTLTVDGATAVIMTGNLVSWDYAGIRDFAVIDTSGADITAITATFNADFAGQPITPPDGADLVWSPTNAQASVLAIIDGAASSLLIEDEEMADPAVINALAAAARRGVNVRIAMTADPAWDPAFSELVKAGVHVRLYPDNGTALYVHAKAIVADAGRSGQRVLVGSQNFSVASLDYNRELGVLTGDPAIVSAIAGSLAGDYSGGVPFSQPANSGLEPNGPGARCTATAKVYNATHDENDVYVYSNQPGQNATASADGYSHSYYTDGSGYALIYLDGPPPGARITVTVGGATCVTRDLAGPCGTSGAPPHVAVPAGCGRVR